MTSPVLTSAWQAHKVVYSAPEAVHQDLVLTSGDQG